MSQILNEQRLRAAIRDWARQSGKRMQKRRIALKLSQQHVADGAGVRSTTISKAELGQIVPKDSVRLAIATVLLCEVVDIWPPIERADAMQIARELVA